MAPRVDTISSFYACPRFAPPEFFSRIATGCFGPRMREFRTQNAYTFSIIPCECDNHILIDCRNPLIYGFRPFRSFFEPLSQKMMFWAILGPELENFGSKMHTNLLLFHANDINVSQLIAEIHSYVLFDILVPFLRRYQ